MSLQDSRSNDLFIVDDEAMMRETLSLVFKLAGYRVTAFADSTTFLAAVHKRRRHARCSICICRINPASQYSRNSTRKIIRRRFLS